jgi:anti-sigma regulatory factor (Ser/Thr protein kinase)
VTASAAARELTESVVLPSDATAARQARDLARRLCREVGLSDEILETAVLLISETVTNAVLHGRSPPVLTVIADSTGVRISVGDDNSRVPVTQDQDSAALTGRGMQLLDACASDWGVTPDPTGGKVVWFECGVRAPLA